MSAYLPAWASPSTESGWYRNIASSRRYRLTLVGAIFCLFTLVAFSSFDRPAQIVTDTFVNRQAPVYNRTLGFHKVFAIGFPGRTDKRDALTLASSYSDFDIRWSNGVAFEDIPAKAIPEGFAKTGLPGSVLGAWRAHLNLLSTIIEEKIETALIFEDDTDWDINIKAQLDLFAKGSYGIQNEHPGTSPRFSPYGSNWDMLWLGHCRAGPTDLQQKLYFIHNDTTVPPIPFRHSLWRQAHILPEVLTNDTRMVFKAHAGMCTFAYAITHEGARKILASLSLKSIAGSYDVAMSNMCGGRHTKPFSCYSIYPPIFSSHRFSGSVNRDSDLQNLSKVAMHDEFTWDIVYSAIQNVPRLITGAKDVLSQWPNDTAIPVRNLTDKYVDQVVGEMKEIKFMEMKKETVKGINSRQ